MTTAADVDGGLTSPEFRQNKARNMPSPWPRADAEIVPGAPDPSVNSDGSENSPVENAAEGSDNGGNDGNAAGGRASKPAWNKPSNGVVKAGLVMGAVSWPALSEATRPSPKSSSASLKALSDGSISVSQGTVVASASQKTFTNNENPSSTPNQLFPLRQNSMKRGDRSSTKGGPSLAHPPSIETPQLSTNKPDPSVPEPSPREGPRTPNNLESGLREGLVPQPPHIANDKTGNNFRRGNRWPHARGDGHYHNNYGIRRDQDRGNQEWNTHRNFNGKDVHLQQPKPVPRGFMRPPTTAPFITSPRSFGNPMGFSDMPSPFYFVPAPHPDMLRGVPFMPHPGLPPMFFPGIDPQLHSALIKQIDYYFSAENLCKDIYLRQNMDAQGWVSISLIAGFNRVKQITTNVQFILDAIRASTVVEVQGDKIRRRNDWVNWILPPVNQSAAISGPPSPATPDYSLENRIRNVGLEERRADHKFQAPVLTRMPSGENSHSAVPVGASSRERVSHVSVQTDNDQFMSPRNSGTVNSC